MDTQDLELAADFCKHVGVPNLLVYVGAEESASPDEVRGKLKARRKFMQGMQGNPKYKKEALLLIKHFQNLNDAVGDVMGYLADARRRAESEHLPVIEMTVRGVLAGGGLTSEQEDYLRRNALELGVTEGTFRELLMRVAKDMAVPVKSAKDPTPAPPPPREPQVDLYTLLGVAPNAGEADIRAAYDERLAELRQLRDPEAAERQRRRIEIAHKVLTNDAARRHYDLTASRTGAPARSREYLPPERPRSAPPPADPEDRPVRLRADQVATAPPVRERLTDPASLPPGRVGNPKLAIEGETTRSLRVGYAVTTTTLVVRNVGDGPMGGAIQTDSPWLVADPKRLDPLAREQTISIQVDPSDVPPTASSAVVTVAADHGERYRVVFEIQRGPSRALVFTFGAVVLVLAVLLAMRFAAG